MATVVETVERDGHQIAIYESGAEYDLTAGHLVKAPPRAAITRENSNDFKRMRLEKSAAMLRSAIKREHNAKMTPVANSSAAVFAESGALLYSEIVLNDEAYPRDRLETWEKLGKYAQVLPSDIRKQDDDPASAERAAAMNMTTALLLERVWSDVMKAKQADVVDGTAQDAE